MESIPGESYFLVKLHLCLNAFLSQRSQTAAEKLNVNHLP